MIPPPPPAASPVLNKMRWSSPEEKDRKLPSRSRSKGDVTAHPMLPKLPQSAQESPKQVSGGSNDSLGFSHFDIPLADGSPKIPKRSGSSSSLPRRRQTSKGKRSQASATQLSSGSLHSALAQASARRSFLPSSEQGVLLKRRTRDSSHQEDKPRSLSHDRPRRRRTRTPTSPLSPYDATAAGNRYNDDTDLSSNDGHDSDDLHDSDDDEEYGSQDSPEKSFPSPLTFSSSKSSKMKGRSRNFKGDHSMTSKGSNVTSISDMLLCTMGPSNAEARPRHKRSAALNRYGNVEPMWQERIVRRQRKIIQVLVLALLLCVGYFYSQGDDTTMWEGNRSKDQSFSSHCSSNLHRSEGVDDNSDEMYGFYEKQIGELTNQVQSVRRAFQKLARQELAVDFFNGQDPSEQATKTRDVNVKLQGPLADLSFDIRLSTSKLPYASWVFLKELSNGGWVIKSKEQWLEMTPARMEDSESRYVRRSLSPSDLQDRENQSYENFDFLENSIDTDRSFVVGIRNAEVGEVGPVVSIYHERSMCGHYQHESCFGRVVNGFNTLNALAEVGDVVPIGQTTIARS